MIECPCIIIRHACLTDFLLSQRVRRVKLNFLTHFCVKSCIFFRKLNFLKLATEHSLKLLCYLDSLIVLGLRYSPGVQKLLHLLLRITMKVLPELLKSLHKIILISLVHVVVQWIHLLLPSNVPLFALILPSGHPFRL